MTAKQKRRKDLLSWRYRYKHISPQQLANSLSVEGTSYDKEVPTNLLRALTEFRKLRQDARVAACRRFIEGI